MSHPLVAENLGLSRSARSFTLPSQSRSDLVDATADHHHRRHRISHRPHRSHQIHNQITQSTIPPKSTSYILGSVRTVAGGLRELGGRTDYTPGKGSGLEKYDNEKGKSEFRDVKLSSPHWSHRHALSSDIERLHAANTEREAELSGSLSKIASAAVSQASALTRAHAALTETISQSSREISELSELLSSASLMFHQFTVESAPELETTTGNHIIALERTYKQVEKQRLDALELRLETANKRVEELGRRLNVVREMVGKEENKELEEARRHKRTMGLAWGAVGFVLMAFLVVVLSSRPRGPRNVGAADGIGEEVLREELRAKGVEWVLEDDCGAEITSVDESCLDVNRGSMMKLDERTTGPSQAISLDGALHRLSDEL